jgi:iron-siderophore transport system ATP-binding protein
VLHNLNQGARYATHIIAMKASGLVARGRPSEIIVAESVEHVYGSKGKVIPTRRPGCRWWCRRAPC